MFCFLSRVCYEIHMFLRTESIYIRKHNQQQTSKNKYSALCEVETRLQNII